MAKCTITQIMPHDRSETLVYTDKRVAKSLYHSKASCYNNAGMLTSETYQ